MDNSFYQELLDNLPDGVYFVDRKKKITYWNKAAERITGYTQTEVLGHRCSDNILRHIDDQGTELCIFGCPLYGTMIDGKIREIDVYLHHKNGYRVPVSVRVSPIRDESKQIVGAVEVFSDNSKQNNLLHEMAVLRQKILVDPLTKVGNRNLANLKLKNRLDEWETYNLNFGIIFLDIDHFKNFNDSYGHNMGDQVLIMVGKTIVNLLRSMDTVCRWGGEEFIVIIPNIDRENLVKIAERIRVFIEKSWLNIDQQNLHVTVSIGATLAVKNDTIESLIARADQQMYQSKNKGRNCLSIAD